MRLLLILLIFPLSLFSQTDIEQIRNDSDVVNYVRAVGNEFFPYYKNKQLSHVMFNLYGRSWIWREKFGEEDGKFTDSVMTKRWIVEDFDNDGKKDLVYYGRIEGDGGIYVFFGAADRRVRVLTDLFARHYPHSIELYKIGNANAIIVGTLKQPTDFQTKQPSYAQRFFHDTLVYKFDGFVEYNDAVKHGPVFDSIQFRPLSNWVGNNDWYITISRNGSVAYVRSRDTAGKAGVEYITEKLAGNIDVHDWQDLIDYIGFAQLNDSFAVKNVSDQSVAYTTIYFANGRKKTIYDYGMRGTYGLQTLYNRIFSRKDAVQWRVVASRKGYLGYKGQF